jgi:hypothetical protein
MIADLDAGRARIWGRTGRVSQRVPFPATAQVQPVEPDGPGDNEVHLRDISVQGAYFVGNQTYDLNESVSVLVEFPSETGRSPGDDGAGDPTAAPAPQWRLRGTVARVEPRKLNGGSVGVGVRFTESPVVDILHLPDPEDDSEPN